MASQLINIDTKKICLLCYKPCFKVDPNYPVDSSSSLTGFKQLLRYLNINIKELFNCSTEFLQWMELGVEVDVQIATCENCSSVTEQFHTLYKQYELIQLQFENCVASLHQSMKNGDESEELVQDFKKQMRPNDSVDLINASIAANLRNTTFTKCALKLQNSIARVHVQQIVGSASSQTVTIVESALNEDQHADMQISNDNQQFHLTNSPYNETETDIQLKNNSKTDDELAQILIELRRSGQRKRKDSPTNSEDNKESQDQDTNNFRNVIDDYSSLETNLQIISVTSLCPKDLQSVIVNTNAIADNYTDNTFSPLSESSHSFSQVDDTEIDNTNSESANGAPPYKRQRNTPYTVHHPKWIIKMMEMKNPNCSICQKSFDTAKLLRNHYYIRHSEHVFFESYKSDLSLTQWNTKLDDALQHLYSISLNSDGIWFKCCYCQSHPKQKVDYKHHLLLKHLNEIVGQIDPLCSERVASSSQDLAYKCEYCAFASNSSSSVKNHTLEIHKAELVLPFMNPGTCKDKCGEAAEAILNELKQRDGQCPKCPNKLKQITGLRRHLLGQHFEEFVQDVKKYLSQQEEVLRDAEDVEYREEMVIPPELEEENI